jgi:hypothetical protein
MSSLVEKTASCHPPPIVRMHFRLQVGPRTTTAAETTEVGCVESLPHIPCRYQNKRTAEAWKMSQAVKLLAGQDSLLVGSDLSCWHGRTAPLSGSADTSCIIRRLRGFELRSRIGPRFAQDTPPRSRRALPSPIPQRSKAAHYAQLRGRSPTAIRSVRRIGSIAVISPRTAGSRPIARARG